MAIKNLIKEEKPPKFERIFEDDECISIWRYNLLKNKYGPVEVEYKWKRGFNPWNQKKLSIGDLVKLQKKQKGS